jgi:hypothetical protein
MLPGYRLIDLSLPLKHRAASEPVPAQTPARLDMRVMSRGLCWDDCPIPRSSLLRSGADEVPGKIGCEKCCEE